MKTRKDLQHEYKLRKSRVGIFQVIIRKDNKIYLHISTDLDKAFNADIFKLNAGMHPNKDLQNDWNDLGSDSFEFEILDELKLNETETPDQIINDLQELLDIYKNEMKSKGQLLY